MTQAPPSTDPAAIKRARLRAALKSNMARRKAQARTRDEQKHTRADDDSKARADAAETPTTDAAQDRDPTEA